MRIEGVTTRANAVRRNEIHSNPANRLSLLEGANDGPIQFTAAVSWQTGAIRGQAPGPGIIEIFSDFPGDMAVYHLAAEVGAGSFAIDSVNPAQSQNPRIVDRQRPVRRAAYWVTFTDLTTGSTSAAIIVE